MYHGMCESVDNTLDVWGEPTRTNNLLRVQLSCCAFRDVRWDRTESFVVDVPDTMLQSIFFEANNGTVCCVLYMCET